jgi:hypothetical protein
MVVVMSNTGHRGYLWDLPRSGLGVCWLVEVDSDSDMRILRMSFWRKIWPPLGRGDVIYGPECYSIALQRFLLLSFPGNCCVGVVASLSLDGFVRVPHSIYNAVVLVHHFGFAARQCYSSVQRIATESSVWT